MMRPRYRGVRSHEIPEATDAGGARVKVIAGEVNGIVGPVRDVVTSPQYLDVSVPPGKTFAHATPPSHTVFAYVIGGAGFFHPERESPIRDRQLVAFGGGEGVSVRAGDEPLRFLLVSGQPIGEPIAWQGPIVMNTDEELQVAFDELERGTFIKKET